MQPKNPKARGQCERDLTSLDLFGGINIHAKPPHASRFDSYQLEFIIWHLGRFAAIDTQ